MTTNKKFFGPFIRSAVYEKWHWVKCCSHYPQIAEPETMICSAPPAAETLCEECLRLDANSELGIISRLNARRAV